MNINEETNNNEESGSLSRDDMIAAGLSPEMVDVALGGHKSVENTLSKSSQEEDENVDKTALANLGVSNGEGEGETNENELKNGFEKYGFKSQEDFENGYASLLAKMSSGEHKQEQTETEPKEQKEVTDVSELEINEDNIQQPDENSEFKLSFDELQTEMSEHGKITDGTRAKVEMALEKAGLPKEILSDYEASKKQVTNSRINEIVSVFGENRNDIFSWAKNQKETNNEVKTITESYNKAVKTQDVETAKSFAKILTNMYQASSKKPVTVVGDNGIKRKDQSYKTEADLMADIQSQVASGNFDMNSLIAKSLKMKK